MKKFILLLVCSSFLYSQQIKVVRDFGFWGGVSFKQKVFSDYSLTLESQFRTFHNSLQLDESFFPILWTKTGKKTF